MWIITRVFQYIVLVASLCGLALRLVFQKIKSKQKKSFRRELGFFHPYCNSGGGGERVLWVLIQALLKCTALSETIDIIVYTGDFDPDHVIIDNVQKTFQISFDESMRRQIRFARIYSRPFLEARHYPVLTMLGQSIGSVCVAIECLIRHVPDVFIDTTGGAFTYPLANLLAGCKVVAYVHYPIISSDMLQKVRDLRPDYNNDMRIATSKTMSFMKLLYYKTFALGYSIAGLFADVVLVNSTWTRRHIENLWGFQDPSISLFGPILSLMTIPLQKKITTLYPPCNTEELRQLALEKRMGIILSIGQFRPEKDHMLQLKMFKILIDRNPKYLDICLVLMGSTRNADDELLVTRLQKAVIDLGIPEKNVVFELNVPFIRMKRFLAHSSVGLHTMWNEHFGISIVEMMAAGLVVVAHNSGGPKDDIIETKDSSRTGFLASTPEEYADAIEGAFAALEKDKMMKKVPNSPTSKGRNIVDSIMRPDEEDFELVDEPTLVNQRAQSSKVPSDIDLSISRRARESTLKFSDEIFSAKIVEIFMALLLITEN